MKKITDAVKKLKFTGRGAACFHDPDTGHKFCQNGLTREEAEKIANETMVTLLHWTAGKTCSQVNC